VSALSVFVVRGLALSDVRTVAKMVEQYWLFESIDGFDQARVERLLVRLLSERHLGEGFIAERFGQPCGYVLMTKCFSLEYGGPIAEIDELFVEPASRNLSVGAALLQAVERSAVEQGCVRVQLQLSKINERAYGFYQQSGYEQRIGYDLLDKPLAYSG
jgi:GNAT superfamily N-acetyltransferase